MIKILYIIDKIKTAGAQKHLLEVVANLDKNLFDYKIVTLEELGIKKIYGLSGIIGLFKLINLIKKEKFDIVHSYLFSENILGSIAAKIANGPVIITSRRDTGMLCQGEKQHILAYRLTNRWVDKIICVSEAVKKSVLAKEKVNPTKVEVIYNGVDVEKFGELAGWRVSGLKKTLGIDDDDSVVGMIANFSWIKGHKDFIEAAQIVLKELPNTKFMLVGDGALLQSHKSQVTSHKLEDKILFLGIRKDIPELLSIMDVSVNASYSEGMSNTILESMAAGVSVVATAVDGNLETVVDGITGILVPPHNPQKIAEAIIKLLKNRDLAKKMGENARKVAQEKFPLERMINDYENLYHQLLKNKVGFILSQFPETHETFILREFNALKNKGVSFEIFSLKLCRDKVIHPEAIALMNRTIYVSTRNIISSLFYILFHPLCCMKAILLVLKTYISNSKELIKASYVFLQCLYLARTIKKKKIKHIHSHWATMPTTAAMILNKMIGIPFSFTAHAWDIFVNLDGLAEKINDAKFLITCTDYNRKYLSYFCKDEQFKKIHLNYHGIDLYKFKKRQFCDSYPDKQLKILSIGRLTETKGFNYLVNACAILKKEGQEFECSIVGEGPLRKNLESNIRKQQLEEDIKLLGMQPQKEIRRLLNETAIFVAPSVLAKNGDRDGIPNVLLEAMATGVPVIATDLSGIPEVVIHQQTGILVPEKDSLALANAIKVLWNNNNLRETLSKNARQLIENKFNTEKNTEELINIFLQNGILN